jgi:hypothetical protein
MRKFNALFLVLLAALLAACSDGGSDSDGAPRYDMYGYTIGARDWDKVAAKAATYPDTPTKSQVAEFQSWLKTDVASCEVYSVLRDVARNDIITAFLEVSDYSRDDINEFMDEVDQIGLDIIPFQLQNGNYQLVFIEKL